jgi:UDP-glucose 4-epimerase
MRALVTGAAGFLGRHIARRFRDSGWEVTGFDLTPFNEPDIEFLQGDLASADSLERAMRGQDVVAHVGAIGDVYLAASDPVLAARVNVVGTANVAEAAAGNGTRVIYASTWEVYGEPRYQPIDEEHPTVPDHPYSITKLAGESLLLAASRLRDVQVVALRLGTAFGPGLRPNSVFRIFIDKARRGEPITIQGDGSQGRQFTHAYDIAKAFELAASASLSGIALNVVAPETVTIKELAERVVERFPSELTFGDPRPGDVPPAAVSAALATAKLGWASQRAWTTSLTPSKTSHIRSDQAHVIFCHGVELKRVVDVNPCR